MLATGEEPVECDLAAVRTGLDARIGPRPDGVASGCVDAGARSWVGLPLTLQLTLNLLRFGSDRCDLVLGQQSHERRERARP